MRWSGARWGAAGLHRKRRDNKMTRGGGEKKERISKNYLGGAIREGEKTGRTWWMEKRE